MPEARERGVPALRLVGWLIGTAWLGGAVLFRALRWLGRRDRIFAQTLPCPRGHAVSVYNAYRCECGASFEGWAFAACPICGQSAGWVACDMCGLVVKNPLL